MTKIFKVVGPPGTGKTRYVAKQTRLAADKYGPDRVMVCSLTKAAANEAAGATWEAGVQARVGTLHSICYNALDRPDVVSPGQLEMWNQEHGTLALSKHLVGSGREDDTKTLNELGDPLFTRMDLFRLRAVPKQIWPNQLREFSERWEDFKDQIGAIDFTDMIELAYDGLDAAPGLPRALFVDEAQDLAKLEIDLIRKWSKEVDTAIIVGDPDQALYGWRGSDQEILGGEIWKVLEQSFRVPREVHKIAISTIRRVQNRLDVSYLPKDEDGRFIRFNGDFDSYGLMDKIENWVAGDKTVMIIAACDYMLERIKMRLRSDGMPYHNPFTNRYNPLRQSETSTSARLQALLAVSKKIHGENAQEEWSAKQVKLWAPMMRVNKVIQRGHKKELSSMNENWSRGDTMMVIRDSIVPKAIDDLMDPTPEWILSAVTTQYAKSLSYPLNIIEKRGIGSLIRDPSVILGTIHSVKGGEADIVIVAPDLSPQGEESYTTPGWSGHDSIMRLFYVAFTRAKEQLLLLEPTGGLHAQL